MAAPTQFDHKKGKLGFRHEYRNVYTATAASTAVTNTTDETLFDTNVSLPPDTLRVGSVVRIRAQGIATATNSTDTLTIVLYIGGLAGTALVSLPATDVADNDTWLIDCTVTIRTQGASGTLVATGTYTAPGAAGTPTVRHAFVASTAIDTTVAQVIGCGADWSVADAGNSCRQDVFVVDLAE